VVEGALKRVVFGILEGTGLLALAETRARGVAILAYHGVTARRADSPLANRRRLHVPLARFEEHVRELVRRFTILPLAEVRASLVKGQPLPRRALVVTFDDGYRNVLTNALPVLVRHSVPSTLFVLTAAPSRLWVDRLEAAVEGTRRRRLDWNGLDLPLTTAGEKAASVGTLAKRLSALGEGRDRAVNEVLGALDPGEDGPDDDRDLLSWDEVRSLARAGVEIGCHADEHEPLPARPEADLPAALSRARRRLEEELGTGAYPFAYPYGSWTRPVRDAVEQAGFSSAVTTDAQLNGDGRDPFLLGRFLVGADDDVARLRASASGLRARLAIFGQG
jgi:peptidoglycan/xylan/chitin deacetylase (PgdA/CDA1 family)